MLQMKIQQSDISMQDQPSGQQIGVSATPATGFMHQPSNLQQSQMDISGEVGFGKTPGQIQTVQQQTPQQGSTATLCSVTMMSQTGAPQQGPSATVPTGIVQHPSHLQQSQMDISRLLGFGQMTQTMQQQTQHMTQQPTSSTTSGQMLVSQQSGPNIPPGSNISMGSISGQMLSSAGATGGGDYAQQQMHLLPPSAFQGSNIQGQQAASADENDPNLVGLQQTARDLLGLPRHGGNVQQQSTSSNVQPNIQSQQASTPSTDEFYASSNSTRPIPG